MSSKDINFSRIEKAILYIEENFKNQPSLDKIANYIGLSSFHFQKLFTDWAGVSPKKFIQYLSIDYAKQILLDNISLLDVALETGLSGTGRLHDLFINIEGMTPGEYKNGGANLNINYNFFDTVFGKIIIASTGKGICYISFNDNKGPEELKRQFPNAVYNNKTDFLQQNALQFFLQDWNNLENIKLHLKATQFQLKVWEALLKIPSGNLSTYQSIAKTINNDKACRAVGTAIGSNPVAFLIPCHRVIQSSGEFGQYRWGSARKTAIIGWESALKELKDKDNEL